MNYRAKTITTSLKQILCKSDAFMAHFIKHLKEEVPHLEELFDSANSASFQSDFIGNMKVIVANLDNILMLESHLYEIAYQLQRQHITANDLPHIVQAFTRALHDVSDSAWDKQIYQEWDNLLQRILQTVSVGISHPDMTKYT